MARDRRKRNSITREEIVTAGFELFESGDSELSLRRLAARIGAAPMSLYAHFGSKEELLDAIADRVLGELNATDPATVASNWLDAATERALRHLDVLQRHPWAVPLLLSRPYPGEEAASAGETYLRLLAGGIPEPELAAAFTALLAQLYGAAAFLTMPATTPHAQSRGEVTDRIRRETSFEQTAAVSESLAAYGSPAHLRRAVRALLAGFSSQLTDPDERSAARNDTP